MCNTQESGNFLVAEPVLRKEEDDPFNDTFSHSEGPHHLLFYLFYISLLFSLIVAARYRPKLVWIIIWNPNKIYKSFWF